MAAADEAGYGLGNAWRDARARLSSLEDWLDPGTIGHLRGRGVGPGYGRRLLADLRAAGLAGTAAEGRATIWPGGSAGAVAWQLTFEQLMPQMTALGLDRATATAASAARQDPGFSFMSQLTIAAWGRRR